MILINIKKLHKIKSISSFENKYQNPIMNFKKNIRNYYCKAKTNEIPKNSSEAANKKKKELKIFFFCLGTI